MIRSVVFLCLALFAGLPVWAEKVVTAPGAVLRGLDKLDGRLTDIDLSSGESKPFGRLMITLGECRYPKGNPSGNAYAYLTIREQDKDVPVFAGWMIASAPALDAMDHPRYDVWVLRCKTE